MGKKGQHVRGGISKSGRAPDEVQHLFITQLSKQTSKQDLYDAFGKFGEITNCVLRDWRSGICGFITYAVALVLSKRRLRTIARSASVRPAGTHLSRERYDDIRDAEDAKKEMDKSE